MINYIICHSFATQNCFFFFYIYKKIQDFLGRSEIQLWSIHDKIKVLIQLYIINRIFCDIKDSTSPLALIVSVRQLSMNMGG